MEDIMRLLPKILEAAGNAPEVLETAVFAAWRKAAGAGLREQAVPFRLFGKTLIVAVPDERWQQQLQEISTSYLFRVNAIVGQPAVTYIEFRVDAPTVEAERQRYSFPRRAPRDQQAHALAKAASLEKAAAAIKDENLRRKFLLAAGSSLERQERDNSSQ